MIVVTSADPQVPLFSQTSTGISIDSSDVTLIEKVVEFAVTALIGDIVND